MRRRNLIKTIGAGTTVAVAGCLGDDDDDTGDDDEAEFTVGMVYATGGLGDRSFNDMAQEGVMRAADEFNLAFRESEPDAPGDVGELQRRFAASDDPDFDLINTIGFVQETDLAENAQEFPDQNWSIVDAVVELDDGLAPNVANFVFREHEGSFQMGVIAALLTAEDFSHGGGETNTDERRVGFVGGVEIPLIQRFEAGYRAGINYIDDDVEFTSAYAGDFSDPATGQEIATTMYDGGADVVYHAAGGTGSGVFEAAQSEGRYAIGVDADQSLTLPEFSDVIVASMLKRVDTAVYEATSSVVEGTFEGGVVEDLGLAEDGIGTAIGQDFEGALPDGIESTLEETRQGIIDGDIDVPDNLDDL